MLVTRFLGSVTVILGALTTSLAGLAQTTPNHLPQLAASSPAKPASSSLTPELLLRLCQVITPGSSFEYDSLFDENFRKLFPYEDLAAIFDQIARKNGACIEVADLGPFAAFANPSTYAFRLKNEKLSIFQLKESSVEAGKFGGLTAQGEILPPSAMTAREVRIPTRDGIHLRTLIFVPKNQSRPPIVLTRTPYFNFNQQFIFGHHFASASYYVERGYGFIYQSVRGVHGSEGEALLFNPMEVQDGADAVKWIRDQSFSNGKIAAIGTSYEGLTAAAAGVENPRGLELVIAGAGPTDSATGTFRNGWLNLALLDYSRYFTRGESTPFSPDLATKLATLASGEFDLRKYDELIFGVEIPEWKRWTDAYADSRSPFWKERSFIRRLPEIKVPTYHVAGLRYDGNMPDTLNNFLEIQYRSASRNQHHLILGYWDHGGNTPAGDGSNLSPFMRKRFDSILAHYLKGVPSPYVGGPRIQVQSHFGASEEDGFVASDHFPLPSPRLALRFASSANGNELNESGQSEKASSSYTMDPGQFPIDFAAQSLMFRFTPEQDVLINGSIDLELFFAPLDVAQTDLIVQFFKEDENGAQQFLSLCAPGGRLENRAPLPYIRFLSRYCHVFGQIKKGEKLGVSLASNLFPNMARNTGHTVADFYKFAPLKSSITLLHSSERPSRLWVGLEEKPNSVMRARLLPPASAQSKRVLPFSLK